MLRGMLVCHCNGVTDHRIRGAVRAGACTLGEVARACGAGGCCGGCRPEISRILRQEAGGQAKSDDRPSPPLGAPQTSAGI